VGGHNRYNIGVALATARALGVDDAVLQDVVEHFHALPGRLEKVAELHGVPVYNDTNATTPDAAAAALVALDPSSEKTVALIAGGTSKTLDPQVFADAILTHAAHLTLLPGSGTDELLPLLHQRGVEAVCVQSLPEAFAAAERYVAEHRDTCTAFLFSPGFSSFGLFTNEYDRGDQFVTGVKKAVKKQ
jgi:UDP-N-acetylmuramoylalanine--D-glutamate ligase